MGRKPNKQNTIETVDQVKQAEEQNIEIKTDEVLDIEYGNETYIVKTVNSEYETKTIILATGNSRKSSNINGEKEFEGKGISYCAICDGFFFKNKNQATISRFHIFQLSS